MKTHLFCILLAAFAVYSIAEESTSHVSGAIASHTAKLNAI